MQYSGEVEIIVVFFVKKVWVGLEGMTLEATISFAVPCRKPRPNFQSRYRATVGTVVPSLSHERHRRGSARR
jgi:hypothetical protein